MLNLKKNFLFISSNVLFFLTILLTYIDLSKFTLYDAVYLYQFSYTTYAIIIFFLISLFLLLLKEAGDKYKIFNIFSYYLILSSGVYVINFPIMDEFILIASSFFFLTHILMNKYFVYDKKNIIFLLILFILFFQSILGLIYDSRSIRYLVIYPCLILTFIYFSNLTEVDEKKQKNFIEYIFYGILVYVIYQFFFWYLKFYHFEMRFLEQKFIGDMQPSYSKSASGHFDFVHIFSGYLILYFSLKSRSYFRILILFFSIFAYWIFADARSSLFVLCSLLGFYFLHLNNLKKIIFILLILLIFFQKNFFNNPINKYLDRFEISVTSEIKDYLNPKKGTTKSIPMHQKEDGTYFYEIRDLPTFRDFGRLSYVLGGIYSIQYVPHKIFFGCGFYGYHDCVEEGRKEVHEKFSVPLKDEKRGFESRKLRPPAAGTILVENGLLILIILTVLCLKFFINTLLFKTKATSLFLYLFFTIFIWTIFSNILDIIFIYLFFISIFRKYLFYKI